MKFIKIFNIVKQQTELINTKEIAFIAPTPEGPVGLYQTAGDRIPWIKAKESIDQIYEQLKTEV